MAPILLDHRALLKTSVLLLALLLTVFAAGFFSGYRKATEQQWKASIERVLDLPPGVEVSEIDIAQQTPETLAPGANIDVDKPDDAPSASLEALPGAASQPSEPDTADVAPEASAQTASSPSASGSASPVQDSPAQVRPAQARPVQVRPAQVRSVQVRSVRARPGQTTSVQSAARMLSTEAKAESPTSASVVKAATPTDATGIGARYSIQVAVFARKANAERQVKKLLEQGVNAYYSSYRNRQGKLRYNVRIGHYAHRRAALAALRGYRSQALLEGGYLVRLSRSLHAENDLTGNELTGAHASHPTAEF